MHCSVTDHRKRGCNPVSSIFGAQLHASGIFFFGVLLLIDMTQSSYLLKAWIWPVEFDI